MLSKKFCVASDWDSSKWPGSIAHTLTLKLLKQSLKTTIPRELKQHASP